MRARRALVVAWIALTVAGALNHTVFDRRFDLLFPHLKYGHVMFNSNPRDVDVLSYLDENGAQHDLADLMETPAPGYRRARLAITVVTKPDYLAELCLHAERAGRGPLTFVLDERHVGGQPGATHRLLCDQHGLR